MAEEAKWYVVHTYSGYENKVADSIVNAVENRQLQHLITDVKIPTEWWSRSRMTARRWKRSRSSSPAMYLLR